MTQDDRMIDIFAVKLVDETEAEAKDRLIANEARRLSIVEVYAWTDGHLPLDHYRNPPLTATDRALRHRHSAELAWMERQRRIPNAVRRDVLSRDCVYCGREATDVDHIMPVSRGGTRDRDNLDPACSDCNSEKLNFTPDEWRAWREEVGLPWPPVARLTRLYEVVAAKLAEANITEEDLRALGF